MSVQQRFGRNHPWAIAMLIAMSLGSLTGQGSISSQAAEDRTPAADSESEGSSEGSAVSEEVAEESDPEIEEEPKESESQQASPKEGKDSSGKDDEEGTPPKKEKRVIGATATILEKQSGLLFRARVDTGAKSCSLHVEDMEIVGEEEGWRENIGKVIHFKVKNGGKETHMLKGRIDGYVIIKTSGSRERRYKVPLTLRWKGIEKTVLVTLSDRDSMEYPLLLGRNFLRGDFLVDVELDSDD